MSAITELADKLRKIYEYQLRDDQIEQYEKLLKMIREDADLVSGKSYLTRARIVSCGAKEKQPTLCVSIIAPRPFIGHLWPKTVLLCYIHYGFDPEDGEFPTLVIGSRTRKGKKLNIERLIKKRIFSKLNITTIEFVSFSEI